MKTIRQPALTAHDHPEAQIIKWSKLELEFIRQREDAAYQAGVESVKVGRSEPVAWMTPSGEGFMVRFTEPMTEVNMGWDKLYATPQPAPAAQPVNQALLEALKELRDIVQDAIDQKSAKDLDSFTLQPAEAAIAQAEKG